MSNFGQICSEQVVKIWRKREITDFYLHFTSYGKMTKVNPVKTSLKFMILELEKKSSIGMNSHKYLHMHYWLFKCDRKNIISKFSGIYALHLLQQFSKHVVLVIDSVCLSLIRPPFNLLLVCVVSKLFTKN